MAECSGLHIGTADDEGFMVPRAWVNPTYNFDTFLDSVNALFRVNNMNYVVMQFTAMDITELHKSPLQGNSKASALFFVLYVIVGALFVMNLFVGFIVDGFNAHNGTTEEDILYSRYTRQIKVHAPRFHSANPPKNAVSKFLRSILETKNFEIFSGSCVLVNIVFMLTGDAAPCQWICIHLFFFSPGVQISLARCILKGETCFVHAAVPWSFRIQLNRLKSIQNHRFHST